MTGVTPVTERGQGSTTEATEAINPLEAIPAIDRSPKLSEEDKVKQVKLPQLEEEDKLIHQT